MASPTSGDDVRSTGAAQGDSRGGSPHESGPKWPSPARPIVVVMGPAGAGKTTVGRLLAARLAVPFEDADDFHDETAKAKMAQGVPLSDADRAPWLARLGARLDAAEGSGLVLACSALRARYRTRLGLDPPTARLLAYLAVPRALLLERLQQRRGHFVGPSLLDSQLTALEAPGAESTFDGSAEPEVIAASILKRIASSSLPDPGARSDRAP